MANICVYKVKVKGKKNHCYAMLGVLPKSDENEILREEGSDENYTLVFRNNCKWSLTYHQYKEFDGTKFNDIPDDPYEAMAKFDGIWEYSMAALSKMLDVNIWYNSGDIDDWRRLECGHCKNGIELSNYFPDELMIEEMSSCYEESDYTEEEKEFYKSEDQIIEIACNLFDILSQKDLREIMNNLKIAGEEKVYDSRTKVSFQELAGALVLESDLVIYDGVHPCKAVESMTENHIKDDLKEQVHSAIWSAYE